MCVIELIVTIDQRDLFGEINRRYLVSPSVSNSLGAVTARIRRFSEIRSTVIQICSPSEKLLQCAQVYRGHLERVSHDNILVKAGFLGISCSPNESPDINVKIYILLENAKSESFKMYRHLVLKYLIQPCICLIF